MTAIAFGTTANQFSLDDFVSAENHSGGSLWSPIREHDEDNHEHQEEENHFLSPLKRRRMNDGSGTTQSSTRPINANAFIVVAFSGFKENSSMPNNFELRDKLLRMVEKLGGRVVSSDADDLLSFDTSVTHVVAPVEARTPRVIVAGLTGKWIVSPEWVIESSKSGSFADEKSFGARRSEGSPFAGESVYLSPRFIEEDTRTSTSCQRRHSRRDYLRSFVETFGGGVIVHSSRGAKFWVVANDEQADDDDDEDYQDEEENADRMVMKWNEFVHFMYPTNLDDDDEEDEDDDDEEQRNEEASPSSADPQQEARHESRRKSGRRRSPSGSNRKESIEWNIEAEPAPCPFGCGRSYTSTIGMKSHLKRFHTDEQRNQSWEMPRLKFQCRYCQYHSDRRSNLERHLNRFHVSDYYGDGSASGTDDHIEGSDS